MKKVALLSLIGICVFGLSLMLSTDDANARPNYNSAFKDMYVKEGTPLAKAVDEVKCNVCHEGKKKKNRNVYGKAVHEALGGEKIKDKDKINAALEKAAKMHSDPEDKDSPTFGELLKEGKLPAGE